jgi:hypothetical protein
MKDRCRADRESVNVDARFGHHEDRTPTHGYGPTREAARAAFAKGGWSEGRGQAGWRLDSERFRSTPRTCGRFRGILSLL